MVFDAVKVRTLAFRRDDTANAQGGAQIIIILISVFIGAVFGLYLTPSLAEACEAASWSFNGSDYEAILDIIYMMVIPILWAVLMILVHAGAGVGVYNVASKLR